MMYVKIEIPSGLASILANQPGFISLINSGLKLNAFLDKFAAHINITSMRVHSETGQQTTLNQQMRIMAHNFTVFTGAGFGLIGIDHKIMRATINFLRNELGIYRFKQIAEWTRENIEWVDDKLRFKGRIDREGWIEQAKTLLSDVKGK